MTLKDFSILICILFGTPQVAADTADRADKLLPCPDSPNCVSSLSDNDKHFIKPFEYSDSLENARQKLIDILENSRGVRLARIESDYLHAEFRSSIFRFVDDVEFYFPAEGSIIHVRSASRMGYYDFGANRRRTERLRAAFNEPVK
ncbi:MAG: DUF1499 domain-containing protein [Desulfobacterales bacterium]|jgi:uncharacterized protein (DUF1499 family)